MENPLLQRLPHKVFYLLEKNGFGLQLVKWLEEYLQRTPTDKVLVNSLRLRTDKGFYSDPNSKDLASGLCARL